MEHSQTTVSKACRLPPVEIGVQMPTLNYSAEEMKKAKIVLFDFVSGLKSRSNWKESYLSGLFRVDGATGEIEPLEPTVIDEAYSSSDRQSFLRKIAILEKNLAKRKQCIDGLARQQIKILEIFNNKDKTIERLEQKLKSIIYAKSLKEIIYFNFPVILCRFPVSEEKYKGLVNRLKRPNVPEIKSLFRRGGISR